jgi:putative addiction module component (TIGR02574 family)
MGPIMRFVAIIVRAYNWPVPAKNPALDMSIDCNELLSLPVNEKMCLVELLWDNLGQSDIPLPEWVSAEVARRRQEMRDPTIGVSHDEVWRRIRSRNV